MAGWGRSGYRRRLRGRHGGSGRRVARGLDRCGQDDRAYLLRSRIPHRGARVVVDRMQWGEDDYQDQTYQGNVDAQEEQNREPEAPGDARRIRQPPHRLGVLVHFLANWKNLATSQTKPTAQKMNAAADHQGACS